MGEEKRRRLAPDMGKSLALRDGILSLVNGHFEVDRPVETTSEAAAACFDAAAACLALLLSEQRETVLQRCIDTMPQLIEKHGRDIRSGDLDRYLSRRRQ